MRSADGKAPLAKRVLRKPTPREVEARRSDVQLLSQPANRRRRTFKRPRAHAHDPARAHDYHIDAAQYLSVPVTVRFTD